MLYHNRDDEEPSHREGGDVDKEDAQEGGSEDDVGGTELSDSEGSKYEGEVAIDMETEAEIGN
jgi:hypothetical protein